MCVVFLPATVTSDPPGTPETPVTSSGRCFPHKALRRGPFVDLVRLDLLPTPQRPPTPPLPRPKETSTTSTTFT